MIQKLFRAPVHVGDARLIVYRHERVGDALQDVDDARAALLGFGARALLGRELPAALLRLAASPRR
jgi:hypothetical protein